jgi:hypothetical protein
MPAKLPVRLQYSITRFVLGIDADPKIVAAVKLSMPAKLMPSIPAGPIGDRDRIQLIKKAASAAAEIAKILAAREAGQEIDQILASTEESPEITIKTPAGDRVVIKIIGRPIQPECELAVVHGDGSSVDADGKQITRAIPVNTAGVTQPRVKRK